MQPALANWRARRCDQPTCFEALVDSEQREANYELKGSNQQHAGAAADPKGDPVAAPGREKLCHGYQPNPRRPHRCWGANSPPQRAQRQSIGSRLCSIVQRHY